MIVKTKIFEFCDRYYKNLSELATAMGISVSQVYRVREGKRQINQKFIVGAMKAFPNHKLDDLFYLTPELPTVTNNHVRQYLAADPVDKSAVKKKQLTENPQQIVKRFISATEEYGQNLKSHTSAAISLREASREMKRSAEIVNKALIYLTSSHN
jgi:hypothetical protein